MEYGIEVDFLPVGEGEHSGDAIALRWKEDTRFRVMVYDGGTAAYGPALKEHIQKYYRTDRIDYLVNSHPDNDHAGGLTHLVETMEVGEVWMHRPWNHAPRIRGYFHDRRMTDASLERRLQDKMSAAYQLEEAALEKGIPVYEPFAGCWIGIFQVLSPAKKRYVHELVPAFEKTPELKTESADIGALIKQMLFDLRQQNRHWENEYLPDSVRTSAENESSAILFAHYNDRGYLLTGDAGVESLKAAADFAQQQDIHLPSCVHFVQIPHHGGRHNVSTEALNRIVGQPVQRGNDVSKGIAMVSAAQKAPTHPKRAVTNAFNRRGFKVVQTKGVKIWHAYGMPERADYSGVGYVPFFYEGLEE